MYRSEQRSNTAFTNFGSYISLIPTAFPLTPARSYPGRTREYHAQRSSRQSRTCTLSRRRKHATVIDKARSSCRTPHDISHCSVGMDTFDYIIVGAGSAGSVLTNRLSQDSNTTICVLEAGPPDRNPYIHLPAGFIKTFYNLDDQLVLFAGTRPLDQRAAHLCAARQDARRIELDQRPHLQSRTAPGFRHLGAIRQQGLGLRGRPALFQAARAAHRRRRSSLSRPRRQPGRHRYQLAASALRRLHRRRRRTRHPAQQGLQRHHPGRRLLRTDDDQQRTARQRGDRVPASGDETTERRGANADAHDIDHL